MIFLWNCRTVKSDFISRMFTTYFVKLLKSENNLGDVKANLGFREVFGVVKMGEQLSTLHKLQDKVKLLRCLEGVVHGGEEWTSDDFLEHLKH